MKYLKTWMGVTSGTYMGRDDGYPERKFQVIETLDDLVRTYDPRAQYFALSPVDVSTVVKVAGDLLRHDEKGEQK